MKEANNSYETLVITSQSTLHHMSVEDDS
jgi:hypothetical protein